MNCAKDLEHILSYCQKQTRHGYQCLPIIEHSWFAATTMPILVKRRIQK